MNATIPPWGYERFQRHPYGSLPRQKLDVYRPSHTNGPAPIVVFFHGGSWQSVPSRIIASRAGPLLARFVAVLPDYRLYPRSVSRFCGRWARVVRWAA